MSEKSRKVTSTGFSFGTVLFFVFLILKLTKTITWSWWWVTAPLWGGLAIVIAFLILAVIIAAIIAIFKK